jgi:hypothetical protein
MTNTDRKGLAAPDNKAAARQMAWLREREEQREMQLAANTEVRQRWIETDAFSGEAEPVFESREELRS